MNVKRRTTSHRIGSAIALFAMSIAIFAVRPTQLKAEDADETQGNRSPASVKPVESPYKACKEYTLINRLAYDKNPSAFDTNPNNQNCPDCGNRVQVVPETGFLVASVQPKDIAGATDLTSRVVDKSIAYLDQNIAGLEKRIACYAKDAPATEECTKHRGEITELLNRAVPELRKDLALARADLDIENARIFDKDATGFVNRTMSGYGFGPQKAKFDPLQGEELESAKATYLQERAIIDAELEKGVSDAKKRVEQHLISTFNEPEYRERVLRKKLENLRENHRKAYLEVFKKYNSPLLVYVSRVNATSGEVEKGLKALLENARHEHQKAVAARDGHKLEFSRLYEHDKDGNFTFSIAKFRRGLLGGERDLLHYMIYTPIVEEVLHENPALCGVATGLSNHLFNKELQNNLGLMAVMMPTLAVAAPLSGAALTATTGVALTGAEVGSFMGAAMGLGFISFSVSDVKDARRQAFNRTGLGDREIQSMERVTEKEKDLAFNVALHPLDWIGVGGASKAIYSGLVRRFVKKDAEELLAAIRAGDRAAIGTANRAISDGAVEQLEALLSRAHPRKLSTEERHLFQELGVEMQMKGFLNKARSPEAAERSFREYLELAAAVFEKPMTPQTRRDLMATAKATFQQLELKNMTDDERSFIARMLTKFISFQTLNHSTTPFEPEALATGFVEELEKMKSTNNILTSTSAQDQAFKRILSSAELEAEGQASLVIPDQIPETAASEIRSYYGDELKLLTSEDRELTERAVYALETDHKLSKTSIKRKLYDIVGRCGLLK